MWNIARNCRLQRVKPKVLFLRCDNIILTNRSRHANRYSVSEYVRGDETNTTTLFTAEMSKLFLHRARKRLKIKKKYFIKLRMCARVYSNRITKILELQIHACTT